MKHKVVSITQVYNELEKDNLARFFKYLKPAVDEIVIYDDCSTDGSFEYSLEQTKHVIRGVKNDFSNEIEHRNILIQKALELKPDFILWIDADEVLSNNAKGIIQELCKRCENDGYDGIECHQINFWRSHSWKRVDSQFNDGWFTRIWKAYDNLSLESDKKGLHQKLFPDQISNTYKQNELFYLHYGFSSEKNLAFKYLTYKNHGQDGYEALERLIDETYLKLEKVDSNLIPIELRREEKNPEKLNYLESRKYVEKYRFLVEKPKFSIVCLIYKSVKWLKLVHEQVHKYTDLSDKEFFFIANDANDQVLDYLKNNYIPHYEYNSTDDQKKEWYINNVYRAWNYGAEKAKGEYIVFVNSDMCFSQGWFESLLSAYNGKNIVSSRLVESGRLRSGIYGIEKNFGNNTNDYQEDNFNKFVSEIRINKTKKGGLYMPLFIRKSDFTGVGMYPEGNLKIGAEIYSEEYAKQGEELISGDAILIEKLNRKGINHITSFDSLVYHFQEGEMIDGDVNTLKSTKQIAVINDYCRGINNERVLWNFLLEGLRGAYKIDIDSIGEDEFKHNVGSHILPDTDIIIQNASFINRASENHYTIVFLQDNLREMRRISKVQERNLQTADVIVTNSIQTCTSYKEYDIKLIPIGIDSNLFRPLNKIELRKKYNIAENKRVGIFVGAFNETKGWSKVKNCINTKQDITWILVSKYKESFSQNNVLQFSNLSQEKLVELLNCSDFFIIGSPVETQCLAALEANLCDIPVVMPRVGIYKDFEFSELEHLGEFDDNLLLAIDRLDFEKYNPRQFIISKGLTIENTIKLWETLLTESFEKLNNSSFIRRKKVSKFSLLKFYKRLLIESFFSFKKYTRFKILINSAFRKLKKTIKSLLKK